jgi:hypothetical protein
MRTVLLGQVALAAAAMVIQPVVAAPTVVGVRSKDGLAFDTEAVTVLAAAGDPELVYLPKATPSRHGPDAGHLICYAVQPAASPAGDATGTGLVFVTSVDQGRSWGGPASVVVNGWPKELTGRRPVGPSAVQLEDGRIRLYFSLNVVKPSKSPSGPTPATVGSIYSAISNDGKAFAFEDGARLDLAGTSDPEVIRLPEPKEGDGRRLGPWLMFVTRDGSTLLATSRDGLAWERDPTFVWTSARSATSVLITPEARDVRLYGSDRTGIVSVRYDPSTGDLQPDPSTRLSVESSQASVSPCGDGATLLVCVRESTDKPVDPRRDRPPLPADPLRPGRPVVPARPD